VSFRPRKDSRRGGRRTDKSGASRVVDRRVQQVGPFRCVGHQVDSAGDQQVAPVFVRRLVQVGETILLSLTDCEVSEFTANRRRKRLPGSREPIAPDVVLAYFGIIQI
jgi:hypothetical protein